MEQEENQKNSPRISWNNQNGIILVFGRGTTGVNMSIFARMWKVTIKKTAKIRHENDFGFVVGNNHHRVGLGADLLSGKGSNFSRSRVSGTPQATRDDKRYCV